METIQLMATKIPKAIKNKIEVCVLPEGKFSEANWFGDEKQIGYTKEDVAEMVTNFENDLPHYTPFLNIGHTNEKVAEVKSVYQIADDTTKQNGLWAVMEVNEEAYATSKEYGYVSGEVYDNYLDADGERHGKVFAGLALTNRPRHKRMQKNKFEIIVEKMRDFFVLAEESIPEDGEEEMTNTEFEAKMAEKANEFDAKLAEKQKELERLETEVFSGKVDVWKAQKIKEGYTPANVDKFAEKITAKTISFEVANDFITMSEKVNEAQVVGIVQYAESDERSPEELGAEDAKAFSMGGEV